MASRKKRPRSSPSSSSSVLSPPARAGDADSDNLPVIEPHNDSGTRRRPVYSARKRVYEEFERRFKSNKIHMDEFDGIPNRVWYQHKREKSLHEYCKYELVNMVKSLEGSLIKESFRPTQEKLAHLQLADLHIDYLTYGLGMDYEKDSPGWTEFEEPQDLSADDILQVLGLRYKDAVAREFVECVQLAFLRDMNKSVGLEGLRAILEFAGKIAFGPDFPDESMAKIITLGPSLYHVQGFPVNIVQSTDVAHDLDHPTLDDADSHQSPASCGSSSYSSTSRNTNIYSDIIVTSVDDSGWAKILIVCDVNTGYQPFTSVENTRLIRKMIAACMHQTEVFGLMINAGFAKLIRLTHDPDKKNLICYNLLKDQYMFLNPVMDCDAVSFHAQDLKRLLHDLVAVLGYARENIRKIEPLLDPPAS